MTTSPSSPPSPGTTAPDCPRCHRPIPPDAARGLCPACLLGAGFFTQPADAPAASDTPPPSPAEIAPEFPQLEILELLGRGGMGAVYKARQRHLDRLVALKLLRPGLDADPSFAERFAREARALAQLNHPGIVTLHEFGRSPGGLYFIVMEFVDGVNLRQLLAAGRLAPREALAIVPPLCDALQYAHDRGIVHRDIKPENILTDRLGRVKIADFGLAKLAASGVAGDEVPGPGSPAPGTGDLTEAGKVMGTPRYMAPEQREHPAGVDHRADIYALGVVLYQMLTGELPDEKQLRPPSQSVRIDVRLDEIVLRALEKDPALRYAAASELKTRIETIAAPAAVPPGSAGPGPEAGNPLPPQPGRSGAFEYVSPRTLFGLPLLHIAHGIDPDTGRARVARGIVAIGGIAQGVFAFGGIAVGGFAFGGVSLGLLAYGGMAAGLLSMGGVGIGLLASFAGLAVAPIALGGLAVGWYAFGGLALGRFVNSPLGQDPSALKFFGTWGQAVSFHANWVNLAIGITGTLICLGVPWWVRRRLQPKPPTPSVFVPWFGFGALYAGFVGLLLLTAGHLPDRVASHFDGDGQANGWMPLGSYLPLTLSLPLVFGFFFALVGWSLSLLPASLINLPHRDYWLAPERRAATAAILTRWMAMPACLLVVLFAELHLMLLLANHTSPPRLHGGPMLAITLGFLVALMVWIVGLVLRFAEPDAPPAKFRRQQSTLFAAILLVLAVPAVPLLGAWNDRTTRVLHERTDPAPEPTGAAAVREEPAPLLPGPDSRKPAESLVSLELFAGGRHILAGERLGAGELEAKLQTLAARQTKPLILLQADQSCTFTIVEAARDACRRAGLALADYASPLVEFDAMENAPSRLRMDLMATEIRLDRVTRQVETGQATPAARLDTVAHHDLIAARLAGDRAAFLRIQLETATRLLESAEARLKTGQATEAERDAAKITHQIATARLDEFRAGSLEAGALSAAGLPPPTPVQPRLLELVLELASARARYGPKHPRRMALEEELATLEKQTPGWRDAALQAAVAEQRRRLVAEREMLSERYLPEHPKMVDNQQKIDALDALIAPPGDAGSQTNRERPPAPASAAEPENRPADPAP